MSALQKLQRLLITLTIALAVASCGGGDDEPAADTGDGGGGGGGGGGSTNTAPTITGTPAASVVQDTAYTFRPTASDANGDPLTFSIQNLPTWAAFNTSTGRLSGTPTQANVGTTNSIVISVSDGTATTSLAAFNLTVTAIGVRAVTLSWTPPTQNANGTPLTDLAGYRVYFGTTAGGNYTNTRTISNPGIATYFIDNLAPSTYYFRVTAFDQSGNESVFSNETSKAL